MTKLAVDSLMWKGESAQPNPTLGRSLESAAGIVKYNMAMTIPKKNRAVELGPAEDI